MPVKKTTHSCRSESTGLVTTASLRHQKSAKIFGETDLN